MITKQLTLLVALFLSTQAGVAEDLPLSAIIAKEYPPLVDVLDQRAGHIVGTIITNVADANAQMQQTNQHLRGKMEEAVAAIIAEQHQKEEDQFYAACNESVVGFMDGIRSVTSPRTPQECAAKFGASINHWRK